MATNLAILGFDRGLMGLSLAVHIVLASLAMAMPLIMVLAEFISIKKKDKDFEVLSKRVSKIFLLFLGIGTASGILISINMLVLWPKFMSLVSQVAILPFSFETIAFFTESLFVAAYFISWGKLKGKYTHVILGIPIVVGGALSAVFITVANAFMNTPVGFNTSKYLSSKIITDVNPLAVFTSPSAATEVSHVVSTTYFMGIFILLGFFAFMLLKKKSEKIKRYYKKAIWLLLILVTIFTVWSILSGMTSASHLVKQQPEKYSAIELNLHNTSYAPEVIGGFLTPGNHLKFALKIPDLQSILATGKPYGVVPGLNQFNKSTEPPLFVHLLFDLMVFGGIAIGVLLAIVIFLRLIRKRPLSKKWILSLLGLSGIFSIVLVEAGWVMAEMARQPWIIYNVMLVKDAASYSSSVIPIGIIIALFYILIIPFSIWVLWLIFKNHPLSSEVER